MYEFDLDWIEYVFKIKFKIWYDTIKNFDFNFDLLGFCFLSFFIEKNLSELGSKTHILIGFFLWVGMKITRNKKKKEKAT